MSKGSSSKGGSGSQKLSEKKLRKMESRALEEKLLVLRACLFEADGKDRNCCASVGPFMKFDRNGLDVLVEFRTKLPADARDFAFDLTKANMEAKYDAAGYGWDDADKRREQTEDGGRFLVLRDKANGNKPVGFAHFRFTVQGDVVDKMLGDTCLTIYDLQLVDAARRKGLGRHCVTLLEMVARKSGVSRVSIPVMQGDDETIAFVSALKKGAFVPDDTLEGVCGFDADLEGFDVYSLRLAPPAPPPAPPTEEEEAAADLRRTRALLLDAVTGAFETKQGRAPTDAEKATLASAVDAKLNGSEDEAPRTGKARRAQTRDQRQRAADAFERAEGRKPTDEELDGVLAVVAPEALPATPAKAPADGAAPSPTAVADVPVEA